MEIKAFYRKWNGKYLEDAGSIVSSEYRSFQTSLANLMKKIALDNKANVVYIGNGHYSETFMLERNGKFCYISRSSIWDRSTPELNDNSSFLIRTAGHKEDWRGGANCYCSIWNLSSMIDKKLNEVHRQV